jgi:pimeloyl-ACP methyl ester carboxylesterase
MFVLKAKSALFVVLFAWLSLQSHYKERSIYESFKPYKLWWNSPSADLVVFIPGLDGCATFFADVLPYFTAKFNVMMFSIPLAGPPLNVLNNLHKVQFEREYSFEGIADELFDKIVQISKENKFNGNVYMIGESFGGFIAQAYAAKYENSTNLKKLVLLSALAKTQLTLSVELKKTFALPVVKSIGLLFPRLAQYIFAVVHQFDVVEPSDPEWMFDLFVREAAAAHHFSVMKRLDLAISADFSNITSSISSPTLLIYGTQDQFTQIGTQQLSQLLLNSESQGLPGGHLPHISHPFAFSQHVLQFLLSH